ncbi:hypothetical protein QTP88_018494 [Uroleucon formosanum]
MCETQWVDRHESLIRFKELHKAIYYALKKLEECSNIETSRTAFQLSISINNSVFIIALHVIEKFFSLTLPLSIALQKVNIDLSYCYERVTDVCQIFKEIRENGDDEFKQIFPNSKESMLEGIIEDRFTNHHHVMAQLQSLIQHFLKNTTDIKDFQEVALFYKDILPNYETFDAEIKIWLVKWKNVSDRDRPTTSLTTLSAMSYDFFPNIHSLLTIMATLPVTTATAERSFSTLRRLKTYLQNNKGETRLTGLALLNIYRNVDLNVEEIIDRFAMLPRKWDFIL